VSRPGDLEALIARLVDERVDARLRELGITTLATEYTGENLPPRTTRRRFFAACRSGKVEQAVRDGRGWRCSVQAWAAYRSRGPEMPVRGCAKSRPDNVVDIDTLLTSSGLRRTR
jgi:hypothetical protein